MGFLGLFFSFQGRINRVQYWVGSIIANVVSGLISNTGNAVMLVGAGEQEGLGGAGLGMGLVMMVTGLASLWVSFAITVKRLHDRGRSGWICLIGLIPIVMIVYAFATTMRPGQVDMTALGQQLVPAIVVLLAVGLYFFIDLGLLPGQPEANAHGDPPAGGFMPASPNRYRNVDLDSRMPSGLGGAEAALDRAIAERRSAPKPAPTFEPTRPSPAPAPSPMSRPIVSPAPQGFGRRGL